MGNSYLGPIIDSHVHLWNVEEVQLDWIDQLPELNRSFSYQDYLSSIQGFNFKKAVFVEANVNQADVHLEIEIASSLCNQSDSIISGMVVYAQPAKIDFEQQIEKLSINPCIKGVREVLHQPSKPKGLCLSPGYLFGVQTLAAYNLSFDICLRCADLCDAVQLVDSCPETQFVLDHCGNINHYSNASVEFQDWKDVTSEIARRANVVCKLSGLLSNFRSISWTSAQFQPIIDHLIDCFGADRILFGSDWPVCTIGGSLIDWINILTEATTDRPDIQHCLFYSNAARVYRLEDV